MKSLDEMHMDSFFERVDAGELILIRVWGKQRAVVFRKLIPKLKNRQSMVNCWGQQLKKLRPDNIILDFDTDSEILDWR